MNDQINFYDLGFLYNPGLYNCYDYCIHFGESIYDDYFPGTKIKRCMYAFSKCGCLGKDINILKDVNGFCKFYCKYFQTKKLY